MRRTRSLGSRCTDLMLEAAYPGSSVIVASSWMGRPFHAAEQPFLEGRSVLIASGGSSWVRRRSRCVGIDIEPEWDKELDLLGMFRQKASRVCYGEP